MEAVPPVRCSLLGILLLLVKLSVLLVQNRIHLYNFLLLKIVFFNRWLSGLAQEAWGSCSPEAHAPPGLAASPVGRVLWAGLAPMAVPVWLAWAGVLGCVRASGLAWKQLGLSAATCRELLLSCLHSLTPLVLLLLLLTRRLCQRAHGRSVVWLLSEALPDKCAVPKLLALLKRLYWWVENAAALTSWHLAYLVAWTTCLASRLLQAAFEHTAQLAQAQEIEPQEGSGPVSESPTP